MASGMATAAVGRQLSFNQFIIRPSQLSLELFEVSPLADSLMLLAIGGALFLVYLQLFPVPVTIGPHGYDPFEHIAEMMKPHHEEEEEPVPERDWYGPWRRRKRSVADSSAHSWMESLDMLHKSVINGRH